MYSPLGCLSRAGVSEFEAFAHTFQLPPDELKDWELDLREQLLNILDHLEGPMPLMEWINFRVGGEIESYIDPAGVTFIRRRVSNDLSNGKRKRSRSRNRRKERRLNEKLQMRRANDVAGATAEEGDPVYEKEKEPEPWPQMEDSDGIQRDAQYNGQGGWGMHFRNPDRPLRGIHDLDFRRVAEHLRNSYGLEYNEIKLTSPGTFQLSFASPQNAKRGGCLQLHLMGPGSKKPNVRLCVADAERLKKLRAIFLRSAWFTDASTNVLFGEGCEKHFQKETDIVTDKKRDHLAELDFASEDVELTERHVVWLGKLPVNEFKGDELRLRQALFDFFAGRDGDSEATLGDLLTDESIMSKMHFMPKRLPLEAWVERRIGSEMIFIDGDGTRLGMVCQLIESNEELLVPTMTT